MADDAMPATGSDVDATAALAAMQAQLDHVLTVLEQHQRVHEQLRTQGVLRDASSSDDGDPA